MQSSSSGSPSGAIEVTSPPWLAEFSRRLGAEKFSTRPQDLHAYRRDMWARSLLAVAAGQPAGVLPAAVVWPSSTQDLQLLVELAGRHDVKLTPYGAGSGVTGGAAPGAGSLVVDMKRLRKFELDRDRFTVRCGVGWNGWHLEQALAKSGLSVGHFPSSIMCSTVGGWLATRGAGQMSTKYGKIEDMVSALTWVTGRGERIDLDSASGGIDWVQLLVGSEGRLGLISEATLAVQAVPQKRLLRGYWFPDVAAGCAAIQQILQRGLRPAVVRLYDELDTLLAGTGRHPPSLNQPLLSNLSGTAGRLLGQLSGLVGKFEVGRSRQQLELSDLLQLLKPDAERAKHRLERWLVQTALLKTEPVGQFLDSLLSRLHIGCLLIIGCEGEPTTTAMEEQLIRDEISRLGGRDLGPEPGEHWLRHRYDVSFKWPRVFAAGAMADTMEFAATWDRLPALYQKVRAAILPHALIMAHFSHAYPDGCSIYFTFMTRALSAGERDDHTAVRLQDDQRRYDEIWQAAIQAALSAGATIGHHHGVGRLRAPFLVDEQGEGMAVLRTLASHTDPHSILNPGRLFVDESPLSPSPTQVTPPRGLVVSHNSLLITAPAELLLGQIERQLREQGLSLGGLPPSAYGRTLGEALTYPQPLEACVSSGRLHDRRVQLFVKKSDGRVMAIPPQPAPRRSTGPDLGQVFVGDLLKGSAKIVGATLRVERYMPIRPALTLRYDDSLTALQAIYQIRRWHGGSGVHSVVLLSRPLVESIATGGVLPPGRLLLLVEGAGPIALAQESMRELAHRLGVADAWLPIPALRDVLSASIDDLTMRWSKLGPLFERPLCDGTLAEQAALLDRLPARFLVGGVHRHGLSIASPDALPDSDATCASVLPDLASALGGALAQASVE